MSVFAALLLAATPQTASLPANPTLQQWQHRDDALNTQYKITMAAMKADDASWTSNVKNDQDKADGDVTYQAALIASERGWLAYRENECKLEGFRLRGGSGEGQATQACFLRVTNARIAELKRLAAP